MGNHLIGYLTRLDFARPAEHRWHPVGSLPVCVFLAAEWRHTCVWPAVHVRAVVGRVHNERVVRDTKLIQHLEHSADVFIMVNHRVVVRALPPPSSAGALWLWMSA